MNNTALLVIDVQQGLLEEQPYRADALLGDIKTLQDRARENGTEVIFVRHHEDDQEGLYRGSPQWEISAEVSPLDGEVVIDKQYSSAFKDTRLDEYLKEKNIQTLIVCGMQTEYCVDATVKGAFERGYNVLIPQGGTTTFDCRLAEAGKLRDFYEQDIWDGRFADVVTMEQALERLG